MALKEMLQPVGAVLLLVGFFVLAIAGIGYQPLLLWGAWFCLMVYFRIYERDNPGPVWLLLIIGGAVAGYWALSYLPGSVFEKERLAR